MAYMDQERKAKLAPAVKAICAKYGVKATLSVRHHSTLVLTITAGPIDFFADRTEPRGTPEHLVDYVTKHREHEREQGHLDVNPYHYESQFTGAALAFLREVMPALNVGNHDRSDTQSDYFDVGWWIDVNVGRWDKPYKLDPSLRPPPPPALPPAPEPEPPAKVTVDVTPSLFVMPFAAA